MQAVWQREVAKRQADLQMFYTALLYGSSNLPEMTFSHTAGTLFASPQPAELFFRNKNICYVTKQASRYCFNADNIYYQVRS